MFPISSLLTYILLALSVGASPISIRESSSVTLPFALNLNVSGSTLPEVDRARASHLISRGKQHESANLNGKNTTLPLEMQKRAASFDVTNTAVTYTTNVDIGSPATSYTLLIDTGSSNTWIGANKKYVPTDKSTSTGKQVAVSYGSGSMQGHEYTDTVSLSPSLVIDQQSIGVADTASGFSESNIDGILGIGPVALTEGTVEDMDSVPTVSDNLYSQKTISTEVIGVSYDPTTQHPTTNGELTFGGIDSTKYTGSITYTPITQTTPSSYYFGIDQTLTYGSSGSNVLSSTAGIVDTGTTLTLLATDAFNRYKSLTGATLDATTGLLSLTNAQYQKLQSLYFTVGGTKFELTPNAQIWPRPLNSAIGGTSDGIYLIISDLGHDSGEGLDFINGYTFLERFYSVFDTTNNRVGLANTANTKAMTN